MHRYHFQVLIIITLVPISSVLGEPAAPNSQPAETACDKIRSESDAVLPFVRTELGQDFVRAAKRLPEPTPRKIYRDDTTKKYYSEAQREKLGPDEQKKLREIDVTDQLYYCTKYGSPLAYCRAVDILGEAGIQKFAGKSIVDYGYGGVGHLRMLASLGADAVGIDVDPFLTALYSKPEDQGYVRFKGNRRGRVTLLEGLWPKDDAVRSVADSGWDVFISKNTLKNGYVHPAEKVDKRMLVDLSVSESDFVGEIFKRLNRGGYFLIYNICPAPAKPGKPYIPWADGTSPFSKELLEKTGFSVIAFNQKDDEQVRKMGHLLGWDEGQGSMSLNDDLFAWYTLAQKPER